MDLTVLGKYGPWPKAGGACSGYLLEAGGRKLLLDCGCGVLGKLQFHCGIHELDGILLSHLHSDHMGDMHVLRYAMPYYFREGLRTGRMPVFLPAAPESVAATIASDNGFEAITVGGGDSVDFMGLQFSFFTVRHPIECNAVRISYEEKTLVYSGDMNTTPGFERFAEGADLLLIDGCGISSLWSEDKPHLSSRLAADVGMRAGAKRVVITHIHPADDESLLLSEAREAYAEADIASEGARYIV